MRLFGKRPDPVESRLTVTRCGGTGEAEHLWTWYIRVEEEAGTITLVPFEALRGYRRYEELCLMQPGDRIAIGRIGKKVVSFRNLTLDGEGAAAIRD